jgi:hypothetical protein
VGYFDNAIVNLGITTTYKHFKHHYWSKTMKNLISKTITVSAAIVTLAFSQLAFSAEPADAVVAFNKAFTDNSVEALLDSFAPEGLQYTVTSSHQGITPDALAVDARGYWSKIAPVVFATTKSYTRTAKILDTYAIADIATVWAEITTVSERKSGGDAKEQTFKEVYLLIKTENGWKIAGVMDNKKLTKLDDTK